MGKDIFMYVLAGVLVTCAGLMVALLVFVPIPTENHDAIMLIVGTVLGWGGAIVTYYFGSSKGSADKTALLKAKE
jgi:drug/metabolite transporter (DMT)-like permease